jgi:hypothetical protein
MQLLAFQDEVQACGLDLPVVRIVPLRPRFLEPFGVLILQSNRRRPHFLDVS